MPETPEQRARRQIDAQLVASGWAVQDYKQFAGQTRIVAEVERRLIMLEELEAVVSANLQRSVRLRQSVLQKAFTGELA